MKLRHRIAAAWAAGAILAPVPALADPGTAIALALWQAFLISGPAVAAVAFTANLIISAAISVGLSYLAKALTPGVSPPGSLGVEIQLQAGGDIPRTVPFGTFATEGSIAYAGTHTDVGEVGNIFLVQVIALADLPLDGVEGFRIDGEAVTWDPDLTSVPFAPFTGVGTPIPEYRRAIEGYEHLGPFDHLWIKFYDGTQTAADPYLVARFGSDPDYPIDSTFVGTGVAYAIVTARYNPEIFNGYPRLRAILRGAKFYDPRKDSTAGGSGPQRWTNKATWAFTKNPKVVEYNILRGITWGSTWLYGLQAVNALRLPAAEWFAAMNVCDELVSKKAGGTEPRYEAGGEIPVSTPIRDAIEALNASCDGRTFEMGGIYKPRVGPPAAAVLAFTDDHVITTDPDTFEPFKSLADTVNGVTATYRDPDIGYERHDAPPRYDAALEAEDGGRRLAAHLQLDLVSNHRQVQRLMKAMLKDGRRDRRHVLTLPPDAYVLEPGDTVEWTSSRNGYVDKAFIVDQVLPKASLDVVLHIREVNPADYDWTPEDDEKPGNPPPIIVAPPGDYPVTGFAAAAIAHTGSGNKKRVGIRCTWTPTPTADITGIQFHWRLKADPDKDGRETNDTPISGKHDILKGIVQNTVYEVRARHRARSDRATPWTAFLEVDTSGGDSPPGAPAGLGVTPGFRFLLVEWTNPGDADLAGVEAWIGPTTNIALAKPAGMISAPAAALVIAGLGNNTTYRVWVRAYDLAGNFSSFTGPITATTLAGTADIANDSITSDMIQALAVTGAKVANLAIDVSKLADGAVIAEKLAANAVVAGKVAIGDLTNLVRNPNFETPDGSAADTSEWGFNGSWAVLDVSSVADGSRSRAAVATADGTSQNLNSLVDFPARAGESFAFFAVVSGAAQQHLRATVLGVDKAHSATGIGNSNTLAAPAGSGWTVFAGMLTMPADPNIVHGRLRIQMNAAGASGVGRITGILLRRASNGQLLVDGEVIASKIGAGQILAQHIAANQIFAGMLVVSDLTNIITNPAFENPETGAASTEKWTFGGSWTVVDVSGLGGGTDKWAIRATGNGASQHADGQDWFTVKPGEPFAASVRVRTGTGGNVPDGSLRIQLICADKDKVSGAVSNSNVIIHTATGGTWADVKGILTVPDEGAVRFAKLRITCHSGNSTGQWFATRVILRRAANGELIVDGSVVAEKIAAGAVIADKLAANAVTAGKINAGAINTSSLMVNGVVITDLIANNAVTNVVAAFTAGIVSYAASGGIGGDPTYTTLQTASIDTVGGTVILQANFSLARASGAGYTTLRVRVRRGSTVLYDSLHAAYIGVAAEGLDGTPIAIVAVDASPGTASRTYTLEVAVGVAGDAMARSLIAINAKK